MKRSQSGTEAELIARIQNAAFDPALWHGTLEAIRTAVDASAIRMLTWPPTLEGGLQVHVNSSPEAAREYFSYYAARNIFFRNLIRKRKFRNGVIPMTQGVSRSELLRSEFYNDFLVPLDEEHAIVLSYYDWSFPIKIPITWVHPVRAVGQPGFGPSDFALLNRIWPHLFQALRVHWRLQEAKWQASAGIELLEYLRTGVFLVNSAGCVVHQNRAALEMTRAGDGLAVQRRRLVAGTSHDKARLDRAIHNALDGGADRPAGTELAVERPSGLRQWLVQVAPLRQGGAFRLGEDVPAAAIFVTDTDQGALPAGDLLSECFGLTAAETRVFKALLEEGSEAELAERLGMAFHTFHTHTKSIYAKLGVRRRSELPRLAGDIRGAADFARRPRRAAELESDGGYQSFLRLHGLASG